MAQRERSPAGALVWVEGVHGGAVLYRAGSLTRAVRLGPTGRVTMRPTAASSTAAEVLVNGEVVHGYADASEAAADYDWLLGRWLDSN